VAGGKEEAILPPAPVHLRKKKRKLAAAEPDRPQPAKVEILRGDRFEERKFDHKGSK